MITATEIEIELNEMKSNHVLYANEESKSLAVIFPGGNNSCDRPLLHYLRKMLLVQGHDVLCLSYTNLFVRKDTGDEKLEKGVFAINKAIEKVKTEKHYENTIFVSRSYGNVISCELKDKQEINIRKSVYISPTSEALTYIKRYPGFIVSGTKDEYLTSDYIIELSQSTDDNVLVFQNGPHSLETDNIVDTIDFCKKRSE